MQNWVVDLAMKTIIVHSSSWFCCDSCNAKSILQPAERVVKAEGNDHSRVPAYHCQTYASHGCLIQHAPHWKSDRSMSPSYEVVEIKDFIAGAVALSMVAAKAGA